MLNTQAPTPSHSWLNLTRHRLAMSKFLRKSSISRTTTPPVFPPATTKKDAPAIPDPRVYTVSPLASPPSTAAPPTVSQCAVHLELLEAFTWFKHRVYREAAFSEIFGEDEEKVVWWRAVVEVAVERFGMWWEGAERELKERGGERGELRVLPGDLVPPLDVLMVWHAYMLNPRRYNEDCLRFGMDRMLETAFPWEQIHAAIDNDKFNYKLPEPAARFFEKASAQAPDVVEELLWNAPPKKSIKCPSCEMELEVPICEAEPERRKRGWISEEFQVECSGCGMLVDMDALCAVKFRKDIKSLIDGGDGARMRATCLDGEGSTYLDPSSPSSFATLDSLNALFRTTFPTPPTITTHPTIQSLTTTLGHPPHPSLPLCTSCYTETPTPYSLNLATAVLRQASFVTKMHNHLWIRSPSLIGHLTPSLIPTLRAQTNNTRSIVHISASNPTSGFLSRAITRFETYFSLFRLQPGEILVPTLDVDLVWHTAMLAPASYRNYCRSHARRFIDHNDKLSTGTLDDAFKVTAKAFENVTGEPYAKCLCWHCETALGEGVDGEDEDDGVDWWKVWKSGRRERRAVRVRVEFYREMERRRRSGMVELEREGLFRAMKGR